MVKLFRALVFRHRLKKQIRLADRAAQEASAAAAKAVAADREAKATLRRDAEALLPEVPQHKKEETEQAGEEQA